MFTFYVEGKGRKAAAELENGDVLRTQSGKEETVASVEVEERKEAVKVYNLEIEDSHTYYVSADEVLVHNACGIEGGDGTPSKNKYYQVTSKENAQALLNSDNPALKGTEFKEVYVWTVQPTLKQAQNSGARYLDTVIEFETNATYSRDTSIVDSSLWDIARVSDRPGPISISNVVEVGFKKDKGWWQFWIK